MSVSDLIERARASDMWPGQVMVFEISPKGEIIDHGIVDAPSFAEHWHTELGAKLVLDGPVLPKDWMHKKCVGVLHDGGMALYVIPPRVAEDTDDGNDDE